MRKVKVTIADENGIVLDTCEMTIRGGVNELYIMEVIPGTTILEKGVPLTIGTGGTEWQDD